MGAQGIIVAFRVLIALKALGALKTHLLPGALRSRAALEATGSLEALGPRIPGGSPGSPESRKPRKLEP